MRKFLVLLVAILGQTGVCHSQTTSSTAQELLTELQRQETTKQAALDLKNLAQSDPSVRAYLVKHLPLLISKIQNPWVFESEVDLTGELKIAEAIPVLTDLLTKNTEGGGPVTMYSEMNLLNDSPGRALVSIGDPAVSATAKLLQSQDRKTRSRAILVLRKINSQAAKDALRAHLIEEPDQFLRKLIAESIE